MSFQQVVEFKAIDSSFSSTAQEASNKVAGAFGKASDSISRANEELGKTATTLTDKLQEAEQQGQEIFKDLLSQSREHGKTVQERVKWLGEELETMRRINQQYTVQERIRARMDYDEGMKRAAAMGGYAGNVEKTRVTKAYRAAISSNRNAEDLGGVMQSAAENEYRDYSRENEGGGRSGGASGFLAKMKGYGSAAMTGAAGALGFGAALSFGGIISKMFSEGRAEHEGIAGMRGLGVNGENIGSTLGMSKSEMIGYTRASSIASGFAANAASRGRSQYATERAFGLDTGSLNELSGTMRMEGGSKTAVDAVREMLGIFKKSDLFNIEKGDFTQLAEKIDFLNTLNMMQGQQLDQINSQGSAQIVSAFGRAGVTDQRLMAYVNPINQAITSPKGGFEQALIFRALKRANPNASLLDLQRQQEEGAFGKGNINAIIGEYKQNFSGDMLTRSLASGLGLKVFQAEKLLEGDFSVLEGGGKDVSMSEIMQKANENTTTISETLAQFNTWLGSQGVSMIKALEGLVNAFSEDGLTGVIMKGFAMVNDSIREGFGLSGGSMLDKLNNSNLSGASKATKASAFSSMFFGKGTPEPVLPQGMELIGQDAKMFSDMTSVNIGNGKQSAWIRGLDENEMARMTPEQWAILFAAALKDSNKDLTQQELKVVIAGDKRLSENIVYQGT